MEVALENIRKSFGEKEVLKGVDLAVEEGEILAVIGPSGSGKTTLLRLLNGLARPTSGTVRIAGRDLFANGNREARMEMALVLQKPVVFKSTVYENAGYALRLRGWGEDRVNEAVRRGLEHVGIWELADKPARTLSGGEQQRLAFCRATVFGPKLLLLDEFTANLDPANIRVLEDAVVDYNRETGVTVIIVTHNLFQARRISRRTALLLGGRIVEVGPTEKMFESPQEERTKAFVSGEMVF